MVCAICGEHQRLCTRINVITMQNQRSQFTAQSGAARFTSLDHLTALRTKPFGQEALLRGLAYAVTSLEGDEQCACGIGHAADPLVWVSL